MLTNMTISKHLASFHKTPPVRLARSRFASACSSIARAILCQRRLTAQVMSESKLHNDVYQVLGCHSARGGNEHR